jgi:hypothetical protein
MEKVSRGPETLREGLMIRISRFLSLAPVVVALLTIASCNSHDDMTGPGGMNATISGNVVSGTSGAGPAPLVVGLAGVTVRANGSNASATTDGNGDFMLTNVQAGNAMLTFDRADLHASGNVMAMAGATTMVTVSIVGNQAVIVHSGHVGEEIEGTLQSVDAAGGKLVVVDQRLGTITVVTNSTTVIRHGGTSLTLAMLTAGQRVHVKAMKQTDGTYLATEIVLQDQETGGEREVVGTVASTDSGAKSFVVTTSSGSVTVKTDASTTFKLRGQAVTFSSLAAGERVEVNGTLQADGSVLAKKVNIES